jgi:hypothetical protein
VFKIETNSGINECNGDVTPTVRPNISESDNLRRARPLDLQREPHLFCSPSGRILPCRLFESTMRGQQKSVLSLFDNSEVEPTFVVGDGLFQGHRIVF